MRMAVGVERKLAVLFLGVEPEQAIELLGLGHVRHHEVEMIERMHPELAGAALRRLGHGADLGHGRSSFAEPKICVRWSECKPPARLRMSANRAA
jgi:hypothetical protein